MRGEGRGAVVRRRQRENQGRKGAREAGRRNGQTHTVQRGEANGVETKGRGRESGRRAGGKGKGMGGSSLAYLQRLPNELQESEALPFGESVCPPLVSPLLHSLGLVCDARGSGGPQEAGKVQGAFGRAALPIRVASPRVVHQPRGHFLELRHREVVSPQGLMRQLLRAGPRRGEAGN